MNNKNLKFGENYLLYKLKNLEVHIRLKIN